MNIKNKKINENELNFKNLKSIIPLNQNLNHYSFFTIFGEFRCFKQNQIKREKTESNNQQQKEKTNGKNLEFSQNELIENEELDHMENFEERETIRNPPKNSQRQLNQHFSEVNFPV